MSKFSKIDENNIVIWTIAADQHFIDSGSVGDSTDWKEGGSIGDTYDDVNNVFIKPQPYSSWTLDSNFEWQPPIPKPVDGKNYDWDGDKSNWKKIPEE